MHPAPGTDLATQAARYLTDGTAADPAGTEGTADPAGPAGGVAWWWQDGPVGILASHRPGAPGPAGSAAGSVRSGWVATALVLDDRPAPSPGNHRPGLGHLVGHRQRPRPARATTTIGVVSALAAATGRPLPDADTTTSAGERTAGATPPATGTAVAAVADEPLGPAWRDAVELAAGDEERALLGALARMADLPVPEVATRPGTASRSTWPGPGTGSPSCSTPTRRPTGPGRRGVDRPGRRRRHPRRGPADPREDTLMPSIIMTDSVADSTPR